VRTRFVFWHLNILLFNCHITPPLFTVCACSLIPNMNKR